MSERPVSKGLAIRGATFGAVLAGAFAVSFFGAPKPLSIACFNLVPDLLALNDSLSATTLGEAALTAIAGAAVGFLLGALASIREERSPARFGLLLSNPATLAAFAHGAQASLLLAAILIVASAVFALAASRDYRAAVLVGIALAGAPFLSNSLLYLYPALFLMLPLVSPWGLAPRRLAGFAVVVWSPFAMALIGLAYLHWLIGDFGAAFAAPPPMRAVFCPEYLALAAGAGLIALAARMRGLSGPAAAFLLGGVVIAACHFGPLATRG